MDWIPTTAILIAALTGAVSALLLRSALRFVVKVWVGRTVIATYDCAEEMGERPGVLWHAWGSRVPDNDATSRQAWEHSNRKLKENVEHTFFGPYVNDFGKPGFFKVTFRLFGIGFGKTSEPVLVLDVVQAPFGGRTDFVLLSQRIIRARELTGSYQDFSLVAYATGSGVYEYRCRVRPEAYREGQITLRFDHVRVYYHVPIWEVL